METPKRRMTDQKHQSLQGPKTRANCEQIRISLQECIAQSTKERPSEPVKKSQTFIDCVQRFLDCEFRNPAALLLNGLFRKLKQVIISKDGRK